MAAFDSKDVFDFSNPRGRRRSSGALYLADVCAASRISHNATIGTLAAWTLAIVLLFSLDQRKPQQTLLSGLWPPRSVTPNAWLRL